MPIKTNSVDPRLRKSLPNNPFRKLDGGMRASALSRNIPATRSVVDKPITPLAPVVSGEAPQVPTKAIKTPRKPRQTKSKTESKKPAPSKAKKQVKAAGSKLEQDFEFRWKCKYPDIDIEREVKFDPRREFRLDFGRTAARVGVEIQGQIWQKGAHSSGVGLERDYEKMNLAQSLGWIVFQFSSGMAKKPENIAMVAQAIRERLPK